MKRPSIRVRIFHFVTLIFACEFLQVALRFRFKFTQSKIWISWNKTHNNLTKHFNLNKQITHIGKSRKLFPKNGRWLRGYPRNFFQTFSRFWNFWAWLRGFSGNYFQVHFMSTYPWKNIFSQKRVLTQRLFRKLFPKSGNSFRKFSCVITRIYEISNFIWNLWFWKKFPKVMPKTR